MDDFRLSAESADRFARLALDCVDREYPNHILHVLSSDEDLAPPRKLTPVFFGCFDWHSAVHGHWTLVRLLRQFPEAPWSNAARDVLSDHFTEQRLQGELDYLSRPDRAGFERPYGLAWLLQLVMECREWQDADSQIWARRFEPLETLAADRFFHWLPKLTHPVRSGEHSQTAFALGLVYDWSLECRNTAMAQLIANRALAFYSSDKDAPLAYEPSGQDFLSPALAEADLLRRVMTFEEFRLWLDTFLPRLSLDDKNDWLTPATVSDPSDGKLAHLDGLNLSRAWMLEGIAHGLPQSDPRRDVLFAAAKKHAESGLASVTGQHYAGGHWLGSFATYLLTKRGLKTS